MIKKYDKKNCIKESYLDNNQLVVDTLDNVHVVDNPVVLVVVVEDLVVDLVVYIRHLVVAELEH